MNKDKFLTFFMITIIITIIAFEHAFTLTNSRGSIIIWFDDGLFSTYEIAYPIMKQYNYVGVVSVITDYVGKIWENGEWSDKQCMTLEQLNELHNNGWEIVSHSCTHPNFSDITHENAIHEINESKQWILKHGFESDCFVYPYGNVAHQETVLTHYKYERTTIHWSKKPSISITTNISTAIDHIKTGKDVILLIHGIKQNNNGDPWELTQNEFEQIIETIQKEKIEVKKKIEI